MKKDFDEKAFWDLFYGLQRHSLQQPPHNLITATEWWDSLRLMILELIAAAEARTPADQSPHYQARAYVVDPPKERAAMTMIEAKVGLGWIVPENMPLEMARDLAAALSLGRKAREVK